ncbi:Uncharacterized protein dnm_015360 [Desulfonema magnum]|uniref:Uncharacterized protein n=1 Tax=Desulfonema magnum TaxID=45655 RepID=A0A975BI75_9BACT|nr:Uncharacterized protein dnm_015360 [Desulfonema magnum]
MCPTFYIKRLSVLSPDKAVLESYIPEYIDKYCFFNPISAKSGCLADTCMISVSM